MNEPANIVLLRDECDYHIDLSDEHMNVLTVSFKELITCHTRKNNFEVVLY